MIPSYGTHQASRQKRQRDESAFGKQGSQGSFENALANEKMKNALWVNT
jgi:hypothetical protein